MIKNDEMYFSGEEILSDIKTDLKGYEGEKFDTLFNDLFNSDFYTIGRFESSNELQNYKNNPKLDGYETELNGVFGAIELVTEFENDLFGEVNNKDLVDPEKLDTYVEYIRAYNIFNNLLDKTDLTMDDEITKNNINAFLKAIKETEQKGF